VFLVETTAKSERLARETPKDENQSEATTDETRGTTDEDGVATEMIEGDATIATKEEIDNAGSIFLYFDNCNFHFAMS
jgi:hypothetical protein